MILSEILSLHVFNNFKSLNNLKGLSNQVTGTAIFDWENREDVERTFNEGEFVLTTLTRLKDDYYSDSVLDSLYSVFDQKVSAFAIKKTFEFNFPKELIDYATKKNIPIFVFETTYIDDIIYVIKNALITDSLNNIQLQKLNEILERDNEAEAKDLVYGINKYFSENLIFISTDIDKNFETIKSKIILILKNTDLIYTLITGLKNLFIIITYPKNHMNKAVTAVDELSSIIGESSGCSSFKGNINKFKTAIWESVYSQMISKYTYKTLIRYDNLSGEKLLFPIVFSKYGEEYHKYVEDIFKSHDEEYSSDFKKTLIAYINNNGNINETANQLYQHSNTIRYRIKKIQSLLNINDSYEAHYMMYTYSKLDYFYDELSDYELNITLKN